MSEVVDFSQAKNRLKAKAKKAGKMRVMCREGHHKWELSKERQFDVKLGKLVTQYKCKYCGKEKSVLE